MVSSQWSDLALLPLLHALRPGNGAGKPATEGLLLEGRLYRLAGDRALEPPVAPAGAAVARWVLAVPAGASLAGD
eukprot:12411846-Alexandrium_andersonii.AAC.1